jgi:uncharacterized membrane protein
LASDTIDIHEAAKRWFDQSPAGLDAAQRHVLGEAAARRPVSRNTNRTFDERLTFSERLADKVAEFGGSWTFILAFSGFLGAWILLNLLLGRRGFDPYPFIFLNLLLSTLAALQAPVIMMSQNRQAAKDRLNAAHDYEVNLKAEIEIMALHEKLDRLRAEEIEALVRRQEEQLTLMRALLETQQLPRS